MYRIVLGCDGVPAQIAAASAQAIVEEFVHRPWHRNVRCQWDGVRLILQADNGFDSNGFALRDEFSDAISACVKEHFDGGIHIVSIMLLRAD
jgi:hypothetical protein